MFESIFLILAIIGVAIVIMTCVKSCSDKIDENTLKALIIFAGVCMVLASVLGRLKLWNIRLME